MSGGSFDYNCYKVQEFADDLKAKINEEINNQKWHKNNKKDPNSDEVNYDHYCMKLSKDTLNKLKKAQKLLDKAGKLAHAIEWLFSGDYGEGTFNDAYKEAMKKSS